VTHLNGQGEHQLTHQSATGEIIEPTWSPDGSQIMYSQCGPGGGGPCALHVMNADGTGDQDVSTPRIPYVDTFNGTTVDPFWGTPFVAGGGGVSIAETNGELEVSVPSSATVDPSRGYITIGVQSQCRLVGDFDVQVDYRLLTPLPPNSANLGFAVFDPNFAEVHSAFVFNPGAGTAVSTQFPVPSFTWAPETASALRIIRAGTTWSAYRLTENGWVLLVTASEADTTDQSPNLNVFSNAAPFSHPDMKLAYDNFRVNSGTFSCPSWWSDNYADWAPSH
jgi:hypothetical protein